MTGPPEGGWVVFAHRTPYAAEVVEILWRLGLELEVLVDNLPDGPVPSDLGPVVTPLDLGVDRARLPTVIPQLTPGHRWAIEGQARELARRTT